MNHNLESLSPSESTEPISTEWDNLAEPDNKEQNTSTPEAEEYNADTTSNEDPLEEQIEIKNKLSGPPKGYKSAFGIAKELEELLGRGVHYETVRKTAENLGITGQLFKDGNGKSTSYYSLEEQIEIKNKFSSPPEGYKTANEIVEELKELGRGVHYETIRVTVKELGIMGQKFKDGNGFLTTYYSPEEQIEIKNKFSSPPEGYKTANEIVEELTKELGWVIGDGIIRKTAKELDITGQKLRGKNGQPTIYYSPEEQERIKNKNQFPPKGYKTAPETAVELKVVAPTIKRTAKKLGINGQEFKKRGHLTIYYSPEEKEAIENELFSKIPEGYQTAEEIAEELKVSKNTIPRTAKKLGINGQEFKGRNGVLTTYYSPEEQVAIENELHPKIPEGYKAADEIADFLEVTRTTIHIVAKKLGINGQKFKGRNGVLTTYYSPEEQAQIAEKIENTTAGTSFPEQTVAFYLQQSGIKLQQGIRPDWMKNPESGRNLEIDIFIPSDNPPPLGIGIEYDGKRWHNNSEYDAKKNSLSRREGVEIIHIRENGCPELSDHIPCINIQGNRRNDLAESIEQLFTMLDVSLPETGIDISRDQPEIYSFMDARGIRNIDSIAEEAIEDGILAVA